MENILFIFKEDPWYYSHLEKKFERGYYINKFSINNNINFTSKKIIDEINYIIKKKNIKKTIFDFDYSSIIDRYFVSEVISEKKILLSCDPEENKKKIFNSLNVFSHYLIVEPTIKKSIELKGRETFLLPLETNEKLFLNKNLKKSIDVFFFGELKSDRKNYLEQLKKTSINLVSHENMRDKLSDKDLVEIINKSKIVLNFSKGVSKYNKNHIYHQFKGRILMSGLCNTFCLSEYSESQNLHFDKKFLTFKTADEMIKIIEELLNNKEYLNKLTNEFHIECLNFADINYFPKIKYYLDSSSNDIENKVFLDSTIIKNRIRILAKKSSKLNLVRETKKILAFLFAEKNLSNLFLTFYLFLIFLFYFVFYVKKK